MGTAARVVLSATCMACSGSIGSGGDDRGPGGLPDSGPGSGGAPDSAPLITSTCSLAGEVSPMNPAGAGVGPTGTYSDWTWPAVEGGLESLEWTLGIESEPTDGYFWSHQFAFAGESGVGGYAGLQMNGGFQADPPSGPVEVTKMALFSIAGPAITAELGDVAYPDARVYGDFDGGEGWNIHVKYEWLPCRTYALRVAEVDLDADGNIWYGGYVRDLVTGDEIYLGRILVPAAWGGFATWSVMWTERFGPAALTDCAQQAHAVATFLAPTGNAGTVVADGPNDHFYDPPSCPSSRFTAVAGGVRQEMGVPP